MHDFFERSTTKPSLSIYTHTYICMCVFLSPSLSIYTHTYICMCVFLSPSLSIYTHTYICMCVFLSRSLSIYTHTYICISLPRGPRQSLQRGLFLFSVVKTMVRFFFLKDFFHISLPRGPRQSLVRGLFLFSVVKTMVRYFFSLKDFFHISLGEAIWQHSGSRWGVGHYFFFLKCVSLCLPFIVLFWLGKTSILRKMDVSDGRFPYSKQQYKKHTVKHHK